MVLLWVGIWYKVINSDAEWMGLEDEA
jgi:hypothetical protein